jgi:dCMP deaminase
MNKWDLRFLKAAEEVATWSKDPSTKVGCVIVDPELQRRTGEGFNGFPRFMSDDPALYEDRETKYSRTLHAELNAVLFSKKTEGCTAYVTHPPCSSCALVLIQSGSYVWSHGRLLMIYWDDGAAKYRKLPKASSQKPK